MSLGDIWPARIEIDGVKLGDVWPCTCLEKNKKSEYDHLVPFHKLSQWLTYSLVEVIETSGLGLKVQGVEKLTGLPEYRNGGLLIDHGVLTLKPEQVKRCGGSDTSLPCFEGNDPLVVEWRALTVVYLDKIHKECEKKLGRPLKLAQVLESGTWTAGREIASKLRPETGGPPISIKVIEKLYYEFAHCKDRLINFFLCRATGQSFKVEVASLQIANSNHVESAYFVNKNLRSSDSICNDYYLQLDILL